MVGLRDAEQVFGGRRAQEVQKLRDIPRVLECRARRWKKGLGNWGGWYMCCKYMRGWDARWLKLESKLVEWPAEG